MMSGQLLSREAFIKTKQNKKKHETNYPESF